MLDDLFDAPIAAYIQNLVLASPLRRLDPSHVNILEDVEVLVTRAAETEVRCRTCATEDDVEFRGRHFARHLRAWLRTRRRVRSIPPPREPVGTNIGVVAATLGLTELDVRLLTFLLAVQRDGDMQRVASAFHDVTLPTAAKLVSWATGLSPGEVLAALEPTGRLVQTGLVLVDDDARDTPRRPRR